MKRRYIREQRTICGPQYMEVDLFHVTPAEHTASPRAKKEKASSLAMQGCNERYSRRYLGQLVATNFTPGKAMLLHLTYNDENLPYYIEDAENNVRNALRKINRRLKSKGAPKAKYIYVTEWQREDEETGQKEVRIHHHMIIECELTQGELKDCWCTGTGRNREPLGLVKCDRAEFEHGSLEGFCKYITKYPRRRRRWRQSIGLQKPERPAPNDTRYTPRKLEEAATDCIDDRDFWESRYGRQRLRGGRERLYAFVGAEARFNPITAQWHVTAKFWADPRRQPRSKKAKKREKKSSGRAV